MTLHSFFGLKRGSLIGTGPSVKITSVEFSLLLVVIVLFLSGVSSRTIRNRVYFIYLLEVVEPKTREIVFEGVLEVCWFV